MSDRFPDFLMLQFWGPDFENHWLGKSRQIVAEMGSLRQRQGGGTGRQKIRSQKQQFKYGQVDQQGACWWGG